jgi:hypothetical protein
MGFALHEAGFQGALMASISIPGGGFYRLFRPGASLSTGAFREDEGKSTLPVRRIEGGRARRYR